MTKFFAVCFFEDIITSSSTTSPLAFQQHMNSDLKRKTYRLCFQDSSTLEITLNLAAVMTRILRDIFCCAASSPYPWYATNLKLPGEKPL